MDEVSEVRNIPPTDPIEKLAWYMDEAFSIPGTRIRVGWDAIIGLIPGLGETIMMLVQAGVVVAAVTREEVPAIVAVRMIINVALDSTIGSIPIIGDIFDAFFKANSRNIRLLRTVRTQRATGRKVSKGRHYAVVFGVLLALTLVIAGSLALIFLVGQKLLQLLEAGLAPAL